MILHETEDREEMFGIYPVTDLFLTTGNSVVNSRQELVMGTGHAKQCVDWLDPDGTKGMRRRLGQRLHLVVTTKHGRGAYPELRPNHKPYGKLVKHPDMVCYYAYGVLISEHWPKSKFGVFQTKDNYANPSRPELITYSAGVLSALMDYMAGQLGRMPRVDMPMPGIGLGGLDEYTVRPLLKKLGDNVHVWKLKN